MQKCLFTSVFPVSDRKAEGGAEQRQTAASVIHIDVTTEFTNYRGALELAKTIRKISGLIIVYDKYSQNINNKQPLSHISQGFPFRTSTSPIPDARILIQLRSIDILNFHQKWKCQTPTKPSDVLRGRTQKPSSLQSNIFDRSNQTKSYFESTQFP